MHFSVLSHSFLICKMSQLNQMTYQYLIALADYAAKVCFLTVRNKRVVISDPKEIRSSKMCMWGEKNL